MFDRPGASVTVHGTRSGKGRRATAYLVAAVLSASAAVACDGLFGPSLTCTVTVEATDFAGRTVRVEGTGTGDTSTAARSAAHDELCSRPELDLASPEDRIFCEYGRGPSKFSGWFKQESSGCSGP